MLNEANDQLQGLALVDPPLSNRPRFDPRMSMEIQRSGNILENPFREENLKEFLAEYHFDTRGVTNTTAEIRKFNPEADNNYIARVFRQMIDLARSIGASEADYQFRIQSEADRITYLHKDWLLKIEPEKQIPQFYNKVCTHNVLTSTVIAAIEKCGSEGPLNAENLRNLLRGAEKLWIYICVGEMEEQLFCRVVQGGPFPEPQDMPQPAPIVEGLFPLRAIIKQFTRLRTLFLTSKKNEKHDHDFILERLKNGINNLREENGYNF